MPRRPRQLVASTDKTVPATYVGKLESNYYCRGWNKKRNKYCRARAGHGTSHPGVGRCSKHGGLQRKGDDRIKSGASSTVKATVLADLIQQERDRVDPLDLSGELAILRAVFANFQSRQTEETVDHHQATQLLDSIGRMVERIERIRSQNAISRPELGRVMQQIWRAIDARVADEDVKALVRDDMLRIAL